MRHLRVVAGIIACIGLAVVIGLLLRKSPSPSTREEPSVDAEPEMIRIQSDFNGFLLKDSKTGCFYVVYGNGGITSRLQPDGKPYCEPVIAPASVK